MQASRDGLSFFQHLSQLCLDSLFQFILIDIFIGRDYLSGGAFTKDRSTFVATIPSFLISLESVHQENRWLTTHNFVQTQYEIHKMLVPFQSFLI